MEPGVFLYLQYPLLKEAYIPRGNTVISMRLRLGVAAENTRRLKLYCKSPSIHAHVTVVFDNSRNVHRSARGPEQVSGVPFREVWGDLKSARPQQVKHHINRIYRQSGYYVLVKRRDRVS